MGTEIERKFLVRSNSWRETSEEASCIVQGYIATGPPTAVRIRIRGREANLNIKQAVLAIRRYEYEYSIPLDDAHEMIERLCGGRVVQKTRHIVRFAGRVWEVDEFAGSNQGLVVAEVELSSEEDPVELPPWVGAEVSGDARYLNTHLALHPFTTW